MLKSKPCVLFTFRRFFHLNIGGFFLCHWTHTYTPPPHDLRECNFIEKEHMFMCEAGQWYVYSTGPMKNACWHHKVESTYIAREPQWLSLRPNRDPPTQKKKNKRPFSRPANKPNKVVVVLYFQWFSRVYRTFCIWTGFLVAPSPLPSIKTCPAIIYIYML